MDEPSNLGPFSCGRRFSRRPRPGVMARLSSSNLEVLVPMSYSYISSEAKKVPNADPAHPLPSYYFAATPRLSGAAMGALGAFSTDGEFS